MDKGIGVVFIDKLDYFKKLNKIILYKTRFEEINYIFNTKSTNKCKFALWIIQEKKVIYCCRNYIKSLVYEKHTLKFIQEAPNRESYMFVKTQKQNYSMRPVLSEVNTSEYNLAKGLEKQIKSCQIDTYSVSSSTEFVNKISKLEIKDQNVFVCFDIKTLYTQVPLKEVAEDILTTIYDKNSNSVFREQTSQKTLKKKFF